MQFKALAILAAVGSAVAQRPTNTSICDYYTTALLKENTAANQMTLLTLVVNTAVIGNYTMPNVGIAVPGILNPNGTYNGTKVNLVPYFNGGLKSSNRGGSAGVAINFLDGGGAAPLMKNMPAMDNTSNQYKLLTHLYEYFGALLGCTMEGQSAFSKYAGVASQGKVHRFMDLDPFQLGYFITQVGLSAASFGVATDDVKAVGMELEKVFGYKCSPAMPVVPADVSELQAICQAESCPMSPMSNNSVCASYMSGGKAIVANATLAMGEGMNASSASASGSGTAASGTTSGSATGSSPASTSSGAAAHLTAQAAVVMGAALFAFAL